MESVVAAKAHTGGAMSQQQKAKVGTNFWARERAPIRLVEQSKVKLTTLSIIAFIARRREAVLWTKRSAAGRPIPHAVLEL